MWGENNEDFSETRLDLAAADFAASGGLASPGDVRSVTRERYRGPEAAPKRRHRSARAIKRAWETVATAIGLILSSPLFLICYFVIRSDGGPVFYRHRRIGMRGRTFVCLKFRTMTVDAEKRLDALLDRDPEAAHQWEQYQKLEDDPRVTRIGRCLRAISLDELPQLVNVLRGEMSLIGPRPVTSEELGRYGPHVDYYLNVRPGITGLWQVSGRNRLSYEERVRLDVDYVRRWSLGSDLRIALKTIPEMLWVRSGL